MVDTPDLFLRHRHPLGKSVVLQGGHICYVWCSDSAHISDLIRQDKMKCVQVKIGGGDYKNIRTR